MILVDPVWNNFALNNPEYQQVLVNIFAPRDSIKDFKLGIDQTDHFENLEQAIKHMVRVGRNGN